MINNRLLKVTNENISIESGETGFELNMYKLVK